MDLIYSLTDGVKSVNILTTIEPKKVEHNIILFKDSNFKITYGNGLLFVHTIGMFGAETGTFAPPIIVVSNLSWSAQLTDTVVLRLYSKDGLNIKLNLEKK